MADGLSDLVLRQIRVERERKQALLKGSRTKFEAKDKELDQVKRQKQALQRKK